MVTTYLLAVWAIVLELAPWLLLGAAVAGALHVLMPGDFIRRHLGGRGAWTTVKAAVVGVPMPLCSCAVIPTGLGLRRDGAGRGAAVSFLISTPQTGVDSVTVTAAFLGWPFALFKLAAAFVTGVVGGLWANAGDPDPEDAGPAPAATASTPAGGRLRAAWDFAVGDLLRMIWRWLVFGILVSALITVAIEPGALDMSGLGGGLAAMALSLVVALPLYVCATASVPIAAALVHAGLPTGAALVFLMAGPATNIATIGAVGRVLGWRTAAIYLATIIVGSVGLGLVYDLFIGFEAVDLGHGAHDHGAWWAIASAVVLCALLAWFAVGDLRRLLTRRPAAAGCGGDAVGGGCCATPAAADTDCCASPPSASCCGGPPVAPATCCGGPAPVATSQAAPAHGSCCSGTHDPSPLPEAAPADEACCGGSHQSAPTAPTQRDPAP